MTNPLNSATPARTRKRFLPVVALALVMSTLGANEGGCGTGLNNIPGEPGLDVGGVPGATWQMTYSDQISVTVKGAAGVIAQKTLSMGSGGTFVVGGVTIDLKALCARGDIACPSDVLPATVRMNQPGADRHYLQVSFNRKGPLAVLSEAVLGGNVDSTRAFAVFLGVGAAASGNCGLLGVSYANGQLVPDLLLSTRAVALNGQIITGYTGGCVVGSANAAAAAGLTVEFRQPISGLRLN